MGAHLSRPAESQPAIRWNWVSQGFANGVGLYAALPVLQSLLGRRRVSAATWRTAVAAGCFLGGFRLFLQLIRRRLTALVTLPERAQLFLAAAASTGVALAVDDHFLGSFLVIWWGLRAVRCLLPKSDLAPVAIMSASASILAPAAFLFRDEHQRQYQGFMEQMAFKMDRVSLLDQSNPSLIRPGLHGWDRITFCDELNTRFPGCHPSSSCARPVALTVAPRIFLMALKMYGPLYLAWSFFKLRLPNWNAMSNILRSAIFLTGYTITQYLGVMWWQSTISPTLSRSQHASFAWLSGLWTLVERPERRPELAIYCSAHAINALYNLAKKRGVISGTPRWLSYPLLIIASGTLAAFKEQHPEFVKKCFGFDDKQAAPIL